MNTPEEVPAGWYGPGHVFIGSVSRGRVVYSTTGRRMKVVSHGAGSTTVVYRVESDRSFQTSEGRSVTIKRPPRREAISPRTVVRFTKESS